jgi:hypothetical protein
MNKNYSLNIQKIYIVIGCAYLAQDKLFDEKNSRQKSRDTVPLNNITKPFHTGIHREQLLVSTVPTENFCLKTLDESLERLPEGCYICQHPGQRLVAPILKFT